MNLLTSTLKSSPGRKDTDAPHILPIRSQVIKSIVSAQRAVALAQLSSCPLSHLARTAKVLTGAQVPLNVRLEVL